MDCMVNTRSMAISKEIKAYLEQLMEPLATHSSIEMMLEKMNDNLTEKFDKIVNDQNEKIIKLEEKIVQLVGSISLQQTMINRLDVMNDNTQQYQRRSSLRIHGIPVEDNKDPMTIVSDCCNEMGITIKPEEIDRAHPIGPAHVDPVSKKKVKSYIVKFKSWESRETFYKARPRAYINGVKKPGKKSFTVSVDLTKRRYNLLQSIKGLTKDNPLINFSIADINCSLAVKLNNDSLNYFNTREEFENILFDYEESQKVNTDHKW